MASPRVQILLFLSYVNDMPASPGDSDFAFAFDVKNWRCKFYHDITETAFSPLFLLPEPGLGMGHTNVHTQWTYPTDISKCSCLTSGNVLRCRLIFRWQTPIIKPPREPTSENWRVPLTQILLSQCITEVLRMLVRQPIREFPKMRFIPLNCTATTRTGNGIYWELIVTDWGGSKTT